jgi:hypothetical protein
VVESTRFSWGVTSLGGSRWWRCGARAQTSWPCPRSWRNSAAPLGSSTTVLSLLHGLEQAWRTGDPNPAGIYQLPSPLHSSLRAISTILPIECPLLTLPAPSPGVRPLAAELHRLPPLAARPLLLPRPVYASGGVPGQAHHCGPPVQGHITEQVGEGGLALPGLQPGLPGCPRARLCQEPGRYRCLAATATGAAIYLSPAELCSSTTPPGD